MTKPTVLVLFVIGAATLAFVQSVPGQAAPPTQSITVTVQGNGTVISDPPGIACPTSCTGNFKQNSSVTLIALADAGGTFLGWGGECAGTDPGCVLKVHQAQNVTASFEALTVSPPAPVPQTGQTRCFDGVGGDGRAMEIDCAGTGQDGETQKGVAWPTPRFTDNHNGTVTDNLTNLIWLQDASCLRGGTWAAALAAPKTLAQGICGLTDNSKAGDWRLPNMRELYSLIDLGVYSPALPPGHPFTNVSIGRYWSSTPTADQPLQIWTIFFDESSIEETQQDASCGIWAVRGGP